MTPQTISIAASKPKKPQPIKARTEITPALVLLGRGSNGKPHAAAFLAEDAELARKAASLMAMHAVEVTGKLRELAKVLPNGRVFGSGRAFAPFVAAKTYAALLAAAGSKPFSQLLRRALKRRLERRRSMPCRKAGTT